MCLLVWGDMCDFRNLFRVGRQVRGLRVCDFRRVDHSPVVRQRCRGSVVQALPGHVTPVPFVFPFVILVTGCWKRCLGGFRRVGGQVDRFRVCNFRRVDHSPVVSQRRRRAVIRCHVGHGVARRCCEDETRGRELKTSNFFFKDTFIDFPNFLPTPRSNIKISQLRKARLAEDYVKRELGGQVVTHEEESRVSHDPGTT